MPGQVCYFNLIMQYQPGIANKLRRQANLAAREDIGIDFYWLPAEQHAKQHQHEASSNLRVLPIRGRSAWQVRYRQAQKINEVAPQYDAAVLRYPQFDPVLAACLRSKSTITLEHHAKEPYELKLRGDPRWRLEQMLGGFYISRFGSLTAVTNEILQYEMDRSGVRRGAVMPNGIDVYDVSTPNPAASEPIWDRHAPLHFLFIASRFNRWHGLEEVFAAWRDYPHRESDSLHIVGATSEAQRTVATAVPNATLHGVLDTHAIAALYPTCHAAITSYRLDLKELREASTLKVREYLAAGLPVFSGHEDSAFPPSFPYYQRQDAPDFGQMRQFLDRDGSATRQSVRDAARPYIDASEITQRLCAFALASSSDRGPWH